MNKNFENLLNEFSKRDTLDLVCRPEFFQVQDDPGKTNFVDFLNENPKLEVIDEIGSQLSELVKLRFPKKKFTSDELQKAIDDHIGDKSLYEYGQWVYYPWLNKVIHVLPEEEFIEVRTNRNHYKITPNEEQLLSEKKIGIIGLSVGKAIALTIALERICGELVLADFDVIELSNLNRIQTGIQNFGLKKTVIVAREIAEIDPYLKVTCLHEGLTEQNVDEFFANGKKLDVCIEVCDGLYTKIFAREKAKELGIPVVMNSSDRGTTDVERYDLDSSLPLLHGLIDHLDISKVKEAKTNEEKVPYLLPMLGVESSSSRLKASMLEIQETITTWPQLASGVVFGGGICTDVCRRILLDQFTKSGRYFVDTEQAINDEVEDYISLQKQKRETIEQTPNTGLDDYENELAAAIDQLKLGELESNVIEASEDKLNLIVEAAILAPSAGNNQPWKWIYKNKRLFFIYDKERGNSILNYKNTVAKVGMGAAAENVILKANELGYEVILNKFPLPSFSDLYAIFSFCKEKTSNTEKKDRFGLVDAVAHRVTNRNNQERLELKPNDAHYLKQLAEQVPGAKLKLFTETAVLDELKEIIAEIDWIIMTCKTSHDQFMNELRWNTKEVEATRDGIDIKTLDISPTEKAGLQVARDWKVVEHVKNWGLGREFGKMSRDAINSSSAVGLLTMDKGSPNPYFDGGRAIQKIWLGATQKGVSFQPMSGSTFISERITDDDFSDFYEYRDKIICLIERMKRICEIEAGEKDVFLFRLSYADKPEVRSLRRKVEDVFIQDGQVL